MDYSMGKGNTKGSRLYASQQGRQKEAEEEKEEIVMEVNKKNKICNAFNVPPELLEDKRFEEQYKAFLEMNGTTCHQIIH